MPPVNRGFRCQGLGVVDAGFFLSPPGPKDKAVSSVDDES